MKRLYSFLRKLSRHNDREWFAAHKAEYLEAKRIGESLARQLIDAVAFYDPEASRLSVGACTYRIYRDTRFSADKTPYKTHFGVFINPPKGKKGLTSGYYFHIEPGNSFVCAGNIGHPPAVLKAIRQSIIDETEEYLSIIHSEEFRRFFPTVGENLLKTAPKGFDKEWEHIDLLKPRNYVVVHPVGDSFFGNYNPDLPEAGSLMADLDPILVQMARFNRFLNFTIEDFDP